jgi:hypothetical protein
MPVQIQQVLPLFFGLSLMMQTKALAANKVSFSQAIRPLLAKRCVSCHGADESKRKGGLRLDTQEGLLSDGTVRAGDAAGSELMRRVLSEDPEEQMPPPDKGDSVTEEERALLQRWIAEGAEFESHWAFEPVESKPVAPLEQDRGWVKVPFDGWVLQDLQRHGLRPAEEAEPAAWLRRMTLAVTGLPPSVEDLDTFLSAHSEDAQTAKERAVDQALSSPAYGERMAKEWLDLARYADTYGRHEDADCTTWPYRDWVIRAFNDNLSYDQFVTWQLAGDLLPNATRDQWIATCFNRLPQQSNEAGSDPEEFRIDQVNDRVNVAGTAFLGLTMECARCHDHKFDPLTMRDFYGLSAFFNNIDELGLFAVFTSGVPPPSLVLHDEAGEARAKALAAQKAELEVRLQEVKEQAKPRFDAWLSEHQPPRRLPEPGWWRKAVQWLQDSGPPMAAAVEPEVRFTFDQMVSKKFVNAGRLDARSEIKYNTKLENGRLGLALSLTGDNSVMVSGLQEMRRSDPFSFGLWIKPNSKMERAVLVHRSRAGLDAACRGFELVLDKMRPSFGLVHFSPGNEIRIRHDVELPVGEWVHLSCVYDGSSRAAGLRLYVNGKAVEAGIVQDRLYRDIVYREAWGDEADKDGVLLGLTLAGRFNDSSFSDGLMDEFVFHQRALTPPEIKQMAGLDDDSQVADWFEWYLREKDEPWQAVMADLKRCRQEENELSGQGVELMVMRERQGPRRPTHLLERGLFDQPRQVVEPDTPAFLPAFGEGRPRNRLGLAQWVMSRDNPLTARVQVNRVWQQFFGRGIVESSEDFGLQGRLPDHPELLDGLALQFMEKGWDVKALCREIALSATFGQSAMPRDPALLLSDPENKHLARGPRRRLEAEQVRDVALAVSGLLSPKIGGPSVKPYQPAGLWNEAGTQHHYAQDHGEKLYRRSLYTFWRRTMPPANMTVFDAPTREFCKARRDNTRTPMQALVLMNDVQFLEAARCLATRLLAEPTPEARVVKAMRVMTSQPPSAQQTLDLVRYWQAERERFEREPSTVEVFLKSTGEAQLAAGVNGPDLAATTLLVRLLFGFSETTCSP